MAGEILILVCFVIFIIIVIIFMRKPKREMTAAERMAYEEERGRLQAQKDFKSRW